MNYISKFCGKKEKNTENFTDNSVILRNFTLSLPPPPLFYLSSASVSGNCAKCDCIALNLCLPWICWFIVAVSFVVTEKICILQSHRWTRKWKEHTVLENGGTLRILPSQCRRSSASWSWIGIWLRVSACICAISVSGFFLSLLFWVFSSTEVS